MLKAVLHHGASGQELHSEPRNGFQILVVTTEPRAHGVFKSLSRTTAGTSIVAQPGLGGSIELSDLIITGDRKNAGVYAVQFNDGTNTETVLSRSMTDAPMAVSIPLVGNWQGWLDARLELVTTLDFPATLAVGYSLLTEGLSYTVWNGLRG